MTLLDALQIFRIIAVVILVVLAAALATPPNRIPLALRGLARLMRKDNGIISNSDKSASVSTWKKVLSFLLIVVAFALAKI